MSYKNAVCLISMGYVSSFIIFIVFYSSFIYLALNYKNIKTPIRGFISIARGNL